MYFRRLILPGLMMLLCTVVLPAHPHMWIKGRLVPELGRKGLESVHVTWDIDELTSAALILDYDSDRSGSLDAAESENLRRGAFEHLIESEYYLLVEIREMLATPGRARDFEVRIEDGRLIYGFRVPLEVAIRWEDLPDVSVYLFDRSYFIDFRPDDIQDVTTAWRDSTVEFRRATRRSMTLGYGMVELTGLSFRRMIEG